MNNPNPNDPLLWDVNNEAMKDVLDICLEHIFEHLGAQDLFNMALVSQGFRATAVTEFGRKFGTAKIELELFNEKYIKLLNWTSEVVTIRDANNNEILDEIDRFGNLNKFTFMRIFGINISVMEIKKFSQLKITNARIKNYVSMYCQHANGEMIDFSDYPTKVYDIQAGNISPRFAFRWFP